MDKKSKKLKNQKWETSKRIEDLYTKLLKRLLDPAKKKVLDKIKKDLKEIEEKSKEKELNAEESKKEIEKLKKDVVDILRNFANSEIYVKKAEDISTKIVTMTLTESMGTWKEAARKASNNPKMYELLMKEFERNKEVKEEYDRLLEQNSRLIKTLPEEIAKKVVEHVSAESFASKRPEVIAKEIRQFFPEHTKAKEKLISRTEAAKAKAALTEARSKSVGAFWYVWHSTGDQRTRSAHAFMNNVICNYRHQPSPEALAKKHGLYEGKTYGKYGPGGIFNCRCFAQPIIDIDLVSFPCKLYDWEVDDVINMNSKKQFIEFAKEKGMPVKSLEDYK